MKCFVKGGYEGIFVNVDNNQKGATNYEKPTEVYKNLTVLPPNSSLNKYKGNCIFYNSYPNNSYVRNKLDPKLFIFDCVDDPVGAFSHWDLGGAWESSVKTANIVLATARKLYKKACQYSDNVILVPNGCDFEHFKQTVYPIPKDMAELPGRKFVFAGALASWLDKSLLVDLAHEYPNDSIVMLGSIYDEAFNNMPSNVHLLGHKPYEQLPQYLNNADTLLIPFDMKNPVSEGTNPIKLWEYLATGRPIVTTDMPEVTMDCVYKTKTKKEFIKKVGKPISERASQKCIETARSNSWDERMSRIQKKMDEFEF